LIVSFQCIIMHIEFCSVIKLWSVYIIKKKNRIDLTRFFFTSQGINEELRLLLYFFSFFSLSPSLFLFFLLQLKIFKKTTIYASIPLNHFLFFNIKQINTSDFSCQRLVYIILIILTFLMLSQFSCNFFFRKLCIPL